MTSNEKTLNTANIQGLSNQIDTQDSAHVLPAWQDLKANDSGLLTTSKSNDIFTLIAQDFARQLGVIPTWRCE